MKSSVIFLDIDGVLNSKKYCTEMFERTRLCKLEDLKPNSLIREMHPEIIQRVAKLASETDSSVVLSSSWKHMWNHSVSNGLAKADMQLMFETFGLHVEDEATPNAKSGNRPIEIRMFLQSHAEVKHWVSLDDDYFPYEYVRAGLPKNVVRTKYDNGDKYGGFTFEYYHKAYEILKNRS